MTNVTEIKLCDCGKQARHRGLDVNDREWPCRPPEWFSHPEHCPAWCIGNHTQSMEEGNPLSDSVTHMGDGTGGWIPELRHPSDDRLLRAGGGGWDMYPKAMPFPDGNGMLTQPVIQLELDYQGKRVTAPLTSGEARTLAAQLVQQADILDLS